MVIFQTLAGNARAVEVSGSGREFARRGDEYLEAGMQMEAVLEYRLAIGAGVEHADVFRNMALALYDLRLLDDAIDSMQKAITADPESAILRVELGVLYLARGDLRQAVDLIGSSLVMDPGRGAAYFYLGEAFRRQEANGLARRAARMAEKLRFDSTLLVDRLRQEGGVEPTNSSFPPAGEKYALRQLLAKDEQSVKKIFEQWEQGAAFESLVVQNSSETEGALGGYAGLFSTEELRPAIRAALEGMDLFHRPVAVPVDDGFLIVQRILPFEPQDWQMSAKGERGQQVAPQPQRGMQKNPFELEEIDRSKTRVYAGSFPTADSAAEGVKVLRQAGFADAAYLRDRKGSGVEVFHVIAGQFSTLEEARQTADMLRRMGQDAFVAGQ